MGFSMNLAVLHEGRRTILEETEWMEAEFDEWAAEGSPLDGEVLSARALVQTLDRVAREDTPNQIDEFWRRLGTVAALPAGTPPEEYPDVIAAGRGILNSLQEAAMPLGFFIEKLKGREPGGRLAMLLMAGMTGSFEAFTLMCKELDPFLARVQEPERRTNRSEHWLVSEECVWCPPGFPPNRGVLHINAMWWLGFLNRPSGMFRLAEFPNRFWLICRRDRVTQPICEPPRLLTDKMVSAYPQYAIVSSEELAEVLDQGYVVDVLNGPYWSRSEMHQILDVYWEGKDPAPARVPVDWVEDMGAKARRAHEEAQHGKLP